MAMLINVSLSGGAAHGVVLAGALTALRQRGLVPHAITGISSGAMAGALAYGTDDREHQLEFFRQAFSVARTRGVRSLLPPYDVSGASTLDFLRPHVPTVEQICASGVRELWVGVSTWPRFGFEALELLADADHEALVTGIARTSMMPFITNDTIHLQGGLDGAFRNNHFTPPGSERPTWLFTYARKPLTSGRGPRKAYERVVLLRSPFRFALHLSRSRVAQGWDEGFAQGMALELPDGVGHSTGG
ncbi:MAG: patatin-like phospholipase family protein [Myxococcota bacterium]